MIRVFFADHGSLIPTKRALSVAQHNRRVNVRRTPRRQPRREAPNHGENGHRGNECQRIARLEPEQQWAHEPREPDAHAEARHDTDRHEKQRALPHERYDAAPSFQSDSCHR